MYKDKGIILRARNMQIEGLRGAATLIIIIYHMFDRYQQIYLDNSISWMNQFGSFGVAIFFVISFYFLVDFNSEKISAQEGILLFCKKLLRLWPMYVVAITLTFIVTHISHLPERTVDLKTYLLNFVLLNKIFDSNYVDGAHWYLTVLISIALISILFRIFNLHKNPLAYIIWVTLSFLVNTIGIRFSILEPDTHLIGGFYVCYASVVFSVKAILEVKNTEKKLVSHWKWLSVILYSVIVLVLWGRIINLLELGVALLLFILCLYRKIGCLENSFLLFIAVVSYPIYLIHQNIGFVIQNGITGLIGEWNYIIPAFASIVVILIGIVLHYLVEKPVMSLKR